LLVVEFQLGIEHLADGHLILDRSGNVVDILRFDESLEVILEDLREVVLQFRSAEIFQDFLPIWWVLPAA